MKLLAGPIALLLASCSAGSSEPDIQVHDAWARPSLPSQSTSAAYFTLSNTGGADQLVSVTSPAADASLHSTAMDGGVMRMRSLDGLDVPAHGKVELRPGGTHVMLMKLQRPLQAGGQLRLLLRFERSGERTIDAAVRAADGAAM